MIFGPALIIHGSPVSGAGALPMLLIIILLNVTGLPASNRQQIKDMEKEQLNSYPLCKQKDDNHLCTC